MAELDLLAGADPTWGPPQADSRRPLNAPRRPRSQPSSPGEIWAMVPTTPPLITRPVEN